MIRVFTVLNKLGLHARPAALFVQSAHRYAAQVRVRKEGADGDVAEVDGKSIMGILTLAAERGAKLTVTAEGEGAEDLLRELEGLFQRRFDEE